MGCVIIALSVKLAEALPCILTPGANDNPIFSFRNIS